MLAALLLAMGLVTLGLLAFLLRFRLWYERQTRGTSYFGRTSKERRAFKAELARRSGLPLRMVRAWTRLSPPKALPGTTFRGIAGPPQCRPADFERALRFRPGREDVFVATQMKCGTTWMQQIVYEVLARGRGDLGDSGYRHIYALSPWIESSHAVRVEDAPRVGERKQRILKTHLPASLCPYHEDARYVYVTRHPVACFASCADFVGSLLGPLVPPLPELVEWFCSDRMWWGPWPDHVDGWWRWAAARPNVLFLHYEELLADLPAAVDRVAGFLETPLSQAERGAVAEKCSFAYMKAHEERFEMAPPTPFSGPESSFLKSGRSDRQDDVGAAERTRILAFCRERLSGSPYPAGRWYADLRP